MRLIDADALKEEVNKKKVVGRFNTLLLIDNAPTVEGQMSREYRQALEVLEHINERYILVEKSPRDDPNSLLVASQQNDPNSSGCEDK